MNKSENKVKNKFERKHRDDDKVVEADYEYSTNPQIPIIVSPFTKTLALLDGVCFVVILVLLVNVNYYGYFYLLWFVLRFFEVKVWLKQN